MLGKVPASRLKLIQRITEAARSRLRGEPLGRDFLAAYFRGVGEDDLAAAPHAERAALALHHLDFGRVRKAGQPLLRVWNPDLARDGHGSPHTLVMVVTDDMPFLVDSLGIALNAFGATHLIIHPVLGVKRDRRGTLAAVGQPADKGLAAESWQVYEIDREVDAATLREIERRLLATLQDVRLAVGDWQAMRKRAVSLAAALGEQPPRLPPTELAEGRALLEWMAEEHFTFLGYRYYRLRRGASSDRLAADAGSGLGLLRRREESRPAARLLAGAARTRARARELLVITKANHQSTVHRAAQLDYVGVKAFGPRGEVVGEHRFIGLWASSAYHQSPHAIPVMRRKVQEVVEHFGLAPQSHDGKAVLHVLETYPRDELFQSNVEELVRAVRGMVNLYERQQVRLFARPDPFGRFWSCLLFVPRDRYNTQVRRHIESLVGAAYGGTAVDTQVQISESALAMLHLRIQTPPGAPRPPPVAAIEALVTEAVRTWADRLRTALLAVHDESRALALLRQHVDTFPAAYDEDTWPEEAVRDIEALERLYADPAGLHLRPYRMDGAPVHTLRLKLFRTGSPIAISDVLPMFENLGMRLVSERPYGLRRSDGIAWIQDFELEHRAGAAIDLATDGPRLLDTLAATWAGRAEDDGMNRLVLAANLTWRDVVLLRAYGKWLLQTGIPFSQAYMEQVLADNSRTAGRLAALFHAQFDPLLRPAARERDAARLTTAIAADLAQVARLDEDRILRGFLNAIRHTLRTNFFQAGRDGFAKPYLSLKFDAANMPDLPLPKPEFEIFVYSPRVEGVHLRKGLVARGGLRWSDRREDFRTEVLGLMKAQNVKNTVIVPVGAKGGFVLKRAPAGREELQREGVACYQDFIRGLLDVTDNIVAGKLVPPVGVVRRDGDDAYLVVAADKGTATFSDIANGVSAEYSFWLGDAFASGGSAGYDHKKMAITARGAWECVRRHFREMDRDTQVQPFTCAGIGDMAGDVFGNGMLRSNQLRLVAAFNHQHIFLDPHADAAAGFRERSRLYALPRSSWDDYDRKAMGKGSGIYPRSAKSITLPADAQAMLGLPANAAAPNEIIRAILRLDVDLLWNGGIGTYVKAADETNADVGDRANDAVRVDGRDVRAKVLGEGGNLGLTQRGRVEYALHGGRLNTDFIDNSAGVNCSDVEVNTKILLRMAIEAGKLKRPARDQLLSSMTDEVAALVLRNNYLQGQALTMLEVRALERAREHAHFIRTLERSGDLDRAIEFLPTEEAFADRVKQGRGLTRPELAVVLSYSKIWLYNQLIASDVPEDPFLSAELARYFPEPVQRRYGSLLAGHPLKREIIATAITNSLVNRMGPSFALRASEDTGASVAAIARAYAIAREATSMRDVWADIEALDTKVPAAVQADMLAETGRQLRHATYWVLGHQQRLGDIDGAVAALSPGLLALNLGLEGVLPAGEQVRFMAREARYATGGVPARLARRVAALDLVVAGLDIVGIATATQSEVPRAAEVYLGLGDALGLDWLRQQVEQLSVDGHWPAVARSTLRDQLYALQAKLATAALRGTPRGDGAAVVSGWLGKHAAGAAALKRTIADMSAGGAADFATLSVALQAVRKLAGD